MATDEKLSPTQEVLMLLNVLTLIHPKLPAYVKQNYGYKISTDGQKTNGLQNRNSNQGRTIHTRN